jgi:serine/threonine protein kinase
LAPTTHENELKRLSALTTGVGTMRYAAPEQLASKKKGAGYGPSVDMYSVGVVLMDMFRNHNILDSELNPIYEAQMAGKVEATIARKMPDGVVDLIESLINREPERRLSAIEVLTR